MSPKYVKHIVYLDIFIIVFSIICLVFSLIVILTDNVSAASVDTNLTNSLSIPSSYSGCSQSNGKYWADDGSSTTCKVFNVKTTYSGVIYSLEMTIKGGWVANEPAFINITAMSTDFRNNNLYCTITYGNDSLPCDLTFNSKSLLTATFTPTVASRNYILGIYSSSYSAITGINTFGIKSVISKQYTGDNSDIINNANQNTQDIIDNINSGIEDVSSNLNNNFLDTITAIDSGVISVTGEISDMRDSLLSGCMLGPTSLDTDLYQFVKGSLNENGEVVSSNTSYRVSPFLYIRPGHLYKINVGQSRTVPYFCFYYGNKGKIECTNYNNIREFNVVAPNNAVYLRVTAISSGGQIIPPTISGPLCNDWSLEKEQAIIDANKEQTDYLKDDSDPTLNQSGIDSALSAVEIDDPLNYLLTLPISLLQKLNTVLSSNSCQRVSFGSLYNTELYLPCINFSQILGTNIWNTIDLFVGVGLLAVILKKFYESISNILTMGKEKEVKDKLDLPTPMEFLASILGGGKD